MPGMTQRCQTCGRVLSNTEFPPVEGKPDERAAQCYQCRNKSWADLAQASATRAHHAREAARSQEIARAQAASARIQEASARAQEANARTQEIRTPKFHQDAVDGERVLFDKGGLKVTQHRFVVERTVYTMQNITSIQHEIDQPPTPPTPPTPDDNHYGIFLIIGAAVCFFSLPLFASSVAVGILLLVVGIALVAYAFGGNADVLPDFLQDLHVPPQKPPTPPTPPAKHTVKLTSAAGEVSAFSTTDGEFVAKVLSALNQAIVLSRP